MKRWMCVTIFLFLLLALMPGCSQKEDIQLSTVNAPRQILEELIVGDIEGALDPFSEESRTQELKDKMAQYAALLDGREYLRCECVDYEVIGTRKEGVCEETTYHKITLKDETVLYAICYYYKDDTTDGLVSFDLYTECPW